jgi:hypothetical protein
MNKLAALVAAVLVAAVAATAAGAAPNTASTVLQPPGAVSGTTLYVTFTVYGATPVVPYEYTLQNTCVYPPKTFGHFTLGQRDAVVTWTDRDTAGNPQVTMPVYLQSVPAGSSCKVELDDNNTAVKGSAVSYTVG